MASAHPLELSWYDRLEVENHWTKHENHTITRDVADFREGYASLEFSATASAISTDWISYLLVDNDTHKYGGFWLKPYPLDAPAVINIGFYSAEDPNPGGSFDYMSIQIWNDTSTPKYYQYRAYHRFGGSSHSGSWNNFATPNAWYWIEIARVGNQVIVRENGSQKDSWSISYDFNITSFQVRQNLALKLGQFNIDYARLADGYEFPPSDPPATIGNKEVVISDMEGCGNWVFAEKEYYNFISEHEGVNSSLLDHIGVSFIDTLNHNITVFYDHPNEEFSVHQGDDYINLRVGSLSYENASVQNGSSLGDLNVTFPIYFEVNIVDSLDVDFYQFINQTCGYTTDWQLTTVDYFNIYNLGGQDLGSLTTSGDASRLAGGDVFDFYAYSNDSSVEASMIFRHLQHVKMLPEMYYIMGNEYATFRVSFGIDFCLNDSDDFIRGMYFELLAQTVSVGSAMRHLNMSITWYSRGSDGNMYVTQPTEYLYFFTHAIGTASGESARSKIWIDFWFNRVNASTTFGGRVNAYEYPMSNNAPEWLRGWYGNWGVDDNKTKESTNFDTLRDTSGNIVSSTSIKLVRVWAKLQVYQSQSGYQQFCMLHNYEAFDLSFGDKNQPFHGIQQPVFDETRVPTMQVGGLLGFLWSGLLLLADSISRAFGPAILGFWNTFVGFLDTAFAWTGTPNAVSQLMSMIANAWAWFTSSASYVGTLVAQGFLLLVEVMTKFTSLVVTIITQFISLVQWTWWILDTGFWSTVSVWDQLGMSSWLVIGAILYPLYLLAVWEEYGFDAMILEINFLVGVVAFLIKGFLTLISLAVQIVFSLIEIVPLAE